MLNAACVVVDISISATLPNVCCVSYVALRTLNGVTKFNHVIHSRLSFVRMRRISVVPKLFELFYNVTFVAKLF